MKSIFFVLMFVLFLIPVAFADHAEVTIIPVDGSGAPGCEEAASGCFIPNTATVDVGGVVIMSNTDSAAHTFTSGIPGDPSGLFDTGFLMAENSYEYSPDTVGEIPYYCMVHPWMIGLIIVQEVEAEEETHDETHEEEHDHDYPLPEPGSRIPQWVKNIFLWFGQDQISEEEIINAIEYLIDEGTIEVGN